MTESIPLNVDRARGEALMAEPPESPWILVPLGNPGPDYVDTRHNLGRLMLQRWMDTHCRRVFVMHAFATGTLYSLKDPLMALVPGTYMNLSGQTCLEAREAGFEINRLLVLHDDKDLPLGLGRLKQGGGYGGHNGLKDIATRLGTNEFARLRLGIGPFQRPLHEFVLQPWCDAEWSVLDTLDAPFARLMDQLLRNRPLDALMAEVNAEAFWIPEKTEGTVPEPL